MSLVDYNPRESANRAASKARQHLHNFVNGFTTGQKAVTLIALVVLIAAIAVFADVSGKASYSPLFTNLSTTDAAAITAKLSSDNVPYQLQDGGTTILVPSSDVDSQRLALAAVDLPTSGSGAGLSLLDKDGITTSTFTEDANYQEAIQDEIESTIDSIAGVQGSQVEIVMPSDTAFALGNNQNPSASVLVDLAPGATLSAGEVQAIMHLTASAVPNLTPSGVTVVDSSGALLSANTSGAAASLSATSSYDAALQSSLDSMLTQVLGPNKAVVNVAATLSSATSSTTSNELQLGANAKPVSTPSSSDVSKTVYDGTGTVPSGILGTNTTTSGSGITKYQKTTTNDSYATGVVTTTTKQPPGSVTRLAVSVVVDKLPRGVSLSSLRTAVAAAAGIDPKRGDTLAVVSIPFSNNLATQGARLAAAQAAAASRARLIEDAKTLAVVLLILAALAVIWRRSRTRRPEMTPVYLQPAPATAEFAPVTAEVPLTLPDVASISVAGTVGGNPDEAARVLRSWLQERGNGG
jgi:flagellar M-ring protein FliF